MENTKPTVKEVTSDVIAGWKKQHGRVWSYKTKDGKMAFFRTPTIQEVEASTSLLSQGKPVQSNKMLAKAIFLGGDADVYEVTDYLLALGKQLAKVVEGIEGELTEL